MDMENFEKQLKLKMLTQKRLLERHNRTIPSRNGLYNRYKYPVLTAEHVPVFWRFDLDHSKNPHFFGECLSKGGLSQEHLSVFKNTLTQIMDNKDLLKIYQDEIALMDPAKEYFEIAINAPKIILANLKTNVIA